MLVRPAARPVLLLVLALSLSLPMIGARDIVTSHEARVAQTARQMAETWPWQGATLDVPEVVFKDIGRGVRRLAPVEPAHSVRVNPWLVPVLNQEIRLQKPPLPYWCTAVLFRMFGFGEGWARLVPALLGAASVVFIYDLARMLMGRTAAWIAGLVWISTFFMLDEHRKSMADPYLAFFTLTAVWAWVRAVKLAYAAEGMRGVKGRDNKSTERGSGIQSTNADIGPSLDSPASQHPHIPAFPLPILLFYLSLAFGLLAKGPIVLLHAGVAIALYHFCFRRRLPGPIWVHALGVLIVVLIGLPWYGYVLLTVPHSLDLWRYESIGELTADNMEHAREWWFYAPNLFLISLPWIIPWAMGLTLPLVGRRPNAAPDNIPPTFAGKTSKNAAHRRRWRTAFAPLWLLAMVLFFSLLQQKKNAYLLPTMGAWTLMTTQGIMILLAAARRGKFRRGSALVPAIQSAAGVVFAVVLIVLIFNTPSAARRTGLLLTIVALGIAIAAAVAIVRRDAGQWLVRQALAYGFLMALFLGFYMAPQERQRSGKPLARQINSLLHRDGYTILVDHLPPEAAVYLPLKIRYEPKPHVLAVADDSRGVKNRRKQQVDFIMPKPDVFRSWVDDGKVVDVQLVPVPRMVGDSRWKLYDLTVDRRAMANDSVAPAPPSIAVTLP